MLPHSAGDFSAIIRRSTALRHLKSVHAAVLRCFGNLHPPLDADLVSQYAIVGSTSLAHSTFSSASSPPSPILFNALIRAYTDHGPPEVALDLYRQMRHAGLLRDYYTFPIVIKACSALRDLELGRSVHRDAVDLGFASNVVVVNALIGFYGKCARPDVARELFDKMPERSPVSWSALISAYARNDRREEALVTFSTMLAEGIQPNRGTLVSLMRCVSDLESADKLWKLAEENELEGEPILQNAAVGMYAACGELDLARKIFEEMPERELLAWNSMIEGYAQINSPLEALALFREMMAADFLPDADTIRGAILIGCKMGSRSFARAIHGYVMKNFEGEGQMLGNFPLINLYSKCGMLGAARRLFDGVQEKNVASWNSMITGYGMHGQGKEAVALFEQMKASGFQPDYDSFSSVLYSCFLADLLDEGRVLFDSMKDLNLDPKSKHYAYMVDMLGRTGRLDEAQDFIKTMPIKPDSNVWGSMLSACRRHYNLELAESSARSILELDPLNARCCVLLLNIYRCSGREKEAKEMETLMKEREIKKVTGFSFVEVNHIVHRFVPGDRLHLQSDMIYKELGRLLESIRDHGYEPNKNLILHDVEEETILETLDAHSEKLAIAFSLLNSAPEDKILVIKNTSICADCHTFAKLVSKIAGRVIVLRDEHRFHHFTNGSCSCKDCW